MKKFVYVTQDMVSMAISELFTAENDAVVERMVKATVSAMPDDRLFTIKDSTVFRLGVLSIDDDTGALALLPYDFPVVVCRAGAFAVPVFPKVGDSE